MKIFVVLSTVLAAAVCDEAVVPAYTAPLTYAAGVPTLAYAAGLPAVSYAAGLPAVSYAAGLPAVTYTAAAPVEAKTITYSAPAPALAYHAAPVAVAAPYVAGSQFHAQDEFGNLNYGYNNINSAKQEVGNTYGGVSGAYSYVDADGKLQQVTYQADALGFRTQDSRLPVAPAFNPEPLVAPVFDGVAPLPVEDTPEVAAARAEHLAAVAAEEAAKTVERRRRDADPAIIAGYSSILSAPTPFIHNAPVVASYAAPAYAYAGLHYAYGYAAPHYYSGLYL